MDNMYNDIQCRTNGEIYIGIVGPVRTGKSTFIKQFMELCVIPYMEDENQRTRTIDELPQSAQGKTIMTTEPKFIPQEAAKIRVSEESYMKVRLIDCVGFMVDGANGHMDENGDRMVKTPWMEEEIPFVDAARIGTQKVIRDHATIGVVLTTDGSIGELERDNYIQAEQETVEEMQRMGKPFVIVLNCLKPYSDETVTLAGQLEKTYHAPVLPINVKQMKREDVARILQTVLYEFPVTRIDFYIPKWTEMLPSSHGMKKALIDAATGILTSVGRMKELYHEAWDAIRSEQEEKCEFLKAIGLEHISLADGSVSLRMDVKEQYYYEHISQMTGVQIEGEYQLFSMIKELSAKKQEYEKVQDALEAVASKGYGVVMPALSEITMEDPVLISHGSKYGVKMRATSPSVHMIKANIETEIAPIVGSREQAEDLIAYIKESQATEGVWMTNIFGKSVGELMEDGIRSKLRQMDDECQMKLQDTMQKIVNDSTGGMICIII